MGRGRPRGHSNRYRTLAADLERRLASHEWPVGKPLPSSRALAKGYGVGIKLIRLALKELASDGRIRIRPRQRPVAALGASLLQSLDKTIALVLSFGLDRALTQGIVLDMLRGMAATSQREGWPYLILQHPARWRTELPAGITDLPLSGIVLIGQFLPRMIERYGAMKATVVVIDLPADVPHVHSVLVDNYNAAFDATARLIAMGHRRLAFLRGVLAGFNIIDPDSRERQEGFIAACRDAGLPVSDYQIFTALNTGGRQTEGVVHTILKARPRYTALVCSGAGFAIPCIKVAERAGLRIPRDLSLAVFHAKGDAADWSGPQIDFEAMGSAAIELLKRRPADRECIRVQTAWHKGRTVAAARVSGRVFTTRL